MLVWSPVAASMVLLANYSMRLDSALAISPVLAWRFLHPIGIVVLLAIQWSALVQRIVGRPVGWKGRPAPEVSSVNR